MLSVTPDTGGTPSDNRDFILPSLERFGLTTKGSEAEALEMYKFCELTSSCWRSKTFSLSTLVRKILHLLYAAICRALENTLCRRCRQRGGCGAKPLPSVQSQSLGRGWEAMAGWSRERDTGNAVPLLALSLHRVLLCRMLLGRSPPLEVLQAAR